MYKAIPKNKILKSELGLPLDLFILQLHIQAQTHLYIYFDDLNEKRAVGDYIYSLFTRKTLNLTGTYYNIPISEFFDVI